MSTDAAARQTRRSALGRLLRDAARLDRTQSDPVVAARNAVGVAAPLAIGVLAGNIGLGLAATIGALQTAFADRPGPYRLRILRMLGTAVAAGATSMLAVLASRDDAASVLLLLVLAFVAGLLLVGGPSATQVGIAGVAAALLLGHLPQSPSVAWHIGLQVVAGGAGQTLLAVASWPLRRHRPERTALAGLYRELAAAARLLEGSGVGPPATTSVTDVRQTLYGLGHDHGPSVEAYRVLLDEAERIRREIVLLSALVERLARAGNPILAGSVRATLSAAGGVLDDIAASLTVGRAAGEEGLAAAGRQAQDTSRRLVDAAGAPAEQTRGAAAARVQALLGQLRAAVDSTHAGSSEGRDAGRSAGDEGRLLRTPIEALRANLTWESAVFRHALRLALLVAGSDLVVRLAGLSRGYWVPLTVLVVLRPDFASTVQRAALRTAGTIVGLVLASELVRALPEHGWWPVAMIAVFAFGMRLAGPGNIALTAVGLSGLVVVLLELNGVPAHTTEISRAVATACGGALAVAAALLLPAWERRFVPGQLGALLDAYSAYLAAVVDPTVQRPALQRARAAARLARTNAQASVDRAQAEPVHARREVQLGRAVLAHSHRFVRATLALDAVRADVRSAGGAAQVARFADAAQAELRAVRMLVVGGRPPEPAPLRSAYDALAEEANSAPVRFGGAETVLTVLDAADRITNSLDTLADEVRRQRDEDDGAAS